MRYFQNKDYKDIANELGITPGNARVVLSRAIDKLGQVFVGAEEFL